MRGEQAIFNLKIKKKSGLSINPDIYHSKVFSSSYLSLLLLVFEFNIFYFLIDLIDNFYK